VAAFAFIMAIAAAGYSLGDISSLLFSADASADNAAAPQSKKKKQAAPPALANPFAAHAMTSDNAFAEAARAQAAAGMRRKDAGEEKLQAAEAMGATDISDPVDVLLAPQDGKSHPVPTSNPQSALDAASSSFAGMYSTCCSGYRSAPTPRPAAAASVFPRQAAAAAQRGPVSPRQLLRIRENEQPCGVATCRRCSHPRPQPLQTWGARHGPAAAAAAVLLCLSFAARIAAAQQTSCSSAWSTAALSVARYWLAATSLPNQGLAIFAGGYGL
jgi:hypothetical protein